MICLNNLRLYSLIACFVVLDAVSQSQDLSSLLLEYPHFVAKHLSGMTANLSLLLFPEKKYHICTVFWYENMLIDKRIKFIRLKNTLEFHSLFSTEISAEWRCIVHKKTSPYVACMSQSLGFILKTNFRIFLAFCFSFI